MNKQSAKILLYGSFFAMLIVGFILMPTICEENRSWLMKNEYPIAYKGYITKKFIDTNDRAEPKISLNYEIPFEFYNYDIFQKVKIGNLLIKEKDTLQYTLIDTSSKDTIRFYPTCRGHEIKGNYSNLR